MWMFQGKLVEDRRGLMEAWGFKLSTHTAMANALPLEPSPHPGAFSLAFVLLISQYQNGESETDFTATETDLLLPTMHFDNRLPLEM